MRLERELPDEEERAPWNLMSERPALRRNVALMDAFRVRSSLPRRVSAGARFPIRSHVLPRSPQFGGDAEDAASGGVGADDEGRALLRHE
ncbi:hypothetical protein ACC771_11260, partial [Rhizobium ruizarguesonis]